MKVVFRDDDVNATTPVEQISRLYEPFFHLGLPVNLSVIPEVRTNIRLPNGELEGFIQGSLKGQDATLPIAANELLLSYLRNQPLICIAQHGLHHDFPEGNFEFDRNDQSDLERRILRGLDLLKEAGLGRPCAFVAPQNRMSRTAVVLLERYFRVVSGSWYSIERVPFKWWPTYLWQKKVLRRKHYRLGQTLFLTHPGHLIGPNPRATVERVLAVTKKLDLTVVLVHHWEFFPSGEEDKSRINALHELARAVAKREEIRVLSFSQLACETGVV